jgi:uroporphyrinogen decarboxylase
MAYQGVLKDFEACVAMKQGARIPVFALGLEFDMFTGGVTCGESRTDIDKTVRATIQAIERYNYDWAVVFPDDYIEFEPLGLKMNHDEDHPAMPREYLPMDRATISGFRIPDAGKEMRLPVHLEMIRRLKKALGDTACVCGRIAAPFSALALVYGVDTLLTKMLEDPDLVKDNARFFVEHQTAFGKAQFEAGADLLWLGDCVAASRFICLDHFSEFAFEPAAEVASALSVPRKHIIYHAAETALPHLARELELPVGAVNVGEGVSIARVKTDLCPKCCLMGNFDPLILRDGTPQQVTAETDRMIRENLAAGGYVFNTGEGIMPNSPPENVEAMMKAARKVLEAELGDLHNLS